MSGQGMFDFDAPVAVAPPPPPPPAPRSFVETRARVDDPETSKVAARRSILAEACALRILIQKSLREHGPQTPKQIAARHGVDFVVLSRRMSEVGFIERTNLPPIDGSAVWQALPWKAAD